MTIRNFQFFTILSLFFVASVNLKAQILMDSSLLKTAITTKECVETPKKFIGKDVVLKCIIIGSSEITMDKDQLVYVLEADERFPDNRVSILITEADADKMNFSRYKYHNRKAIVKGKLVKNKKFKDGFGNPRYTISVSDLDQITLY
jgi:hypothetical protein